MSKRTSIRIPDELYAQLVERAKKEQRTVSNLVVALLTQVLTQKKGASDDNTTLY